MRPTMPHPTLQNSAAADDGNNNNPFEVVPNFGPVRYRFEVWYQLRACQNGQKFELIAAGVPQEWHWTDWLLIERNLAKYMDEALRHIPVPWDAPAPSEAECNELRLDVIRLWDKGKFVLSFRSKHFDAYHEYFIAEFESYELVKAEWSS